MVFKIQIEPPLLESLANKGRREWQILPALPLQAARSSALLVAPGA